MIKKLDILIIRSFVGPFVVTFFVALFVLVMQFFWLYMDELIGKGIGIWTIVQLLTYMSTTLVPLALPLSILLASIMTFGSLGENFELVAIKSSGISLLRFLRPLLIVITIVSYGAFLFGNNVIPVANLKAFSLLYDIRNSKPMLNIRPDQFYNDIQGYSIRVGSKDKDGNTIRDVIIYDHTDMLGNNKVILAKEGQMISAPDKQSLVFKLRDGWRYEEGYTHGLNDFTQTRMHFTKWDKVFDLSGFNFTRTNQDMFKTNYQMYNVKQLSELMDTIKINRKKNYNAVTSFMSPYVTSEVKSSETARIARYADSAGAPARKYDSSFVQIVSDSLRLVVMASTSASIRSVKNLLDGNVITKKMDDENFMKYDIEWHRKFTLSFACILLFLIGAPLGAIIRKGGLGMPLVIAVIFFMAFHILNITGEKMAKTGSVAPWVGMWLSTSCLLPLAFWLVKAARNDSQIFTKEWYLRMWRRITGILPAKKNNIG